MKLIENQISIIKSFIQNSPSQICYLAAPDYICSRHRDFVSKDFTIIDLEGDFSPYKPFLEILSYHTPTKKDVTEAAYSLQKDSFISYFKNGYADSRYDLPIENETAYETKRYIRTICLLTEKLVNRNYLILNAQNLFSASIKLMEQMENYPTKAKFVFCFNSNQYEHSSPSVQKFLESCTNKMNYLLIKENIDFSGKLIQAEEKPSAFDSITSYNEIFSCMRNNRIFMTYEQFRHYATEITKCLSKIELTHEQRRQISFEIGLNFFGCKIYDEAILYMNYVIDSQKDDQLTVGALHCLSKIFYMKKSNDMAKKYILKINELLKGNEKSPFYALNAMVEFQFSKRTDLNDTISKYNRALEQLEKHGFINNYVATGLSIPWNIINDVKSRPLIDAKIEKCCRLAQKIDNQQLVSKAFHWKGIIMSHYGEGEKAMDYFRECNRIRTEIGELGPILNIRNGLSYESSCRAHYDDAYNLVNDIIKNLYTLSDYSSVIDTLKNIAYALFYSRHYNQANEIFNRILHYLSIFNMEFHTNNSFLPSTNDILLFKTIIGMDRGDYIHSKSNFANINANPYTITSEDRPFIRFVEAVLYLRDDDIINGLASFDKCIQEFKNIKSDLSHKIVFCYYEFAVVLEQSNNPDLAKIFLQKGHDLAAEKKFEYYTKGRDSITTSIYLNDIKPFPELKIDLAFLDEKAEKEVLVSQLHKRIHDYKFLNKVRSNNISTITFLKYIEDSMAACFEYTMADAVLLCEQKGKDVSVVYSINRNGNNVPLTENVLKSLFTHSKKNPDCELMVFPEQNLYFGNLSQFNYKYGVVIIPGKNMPIVSDTLSTINIALYTIQSQITIYKQKDNLVFLSSTDQLSLLYNRHALQEYIESESLYLKKNKSIRSKKQTFTICFMDLDNFKFYNDHFGHSAGDILIRCFADLLKETYRSGDFIARFGGDEFVVVMKNTSIEEARHLFDEMKQNLKKKNYFIPELKGSMPENELEIPSDRFLGFSAGLSQNTDLKSPWALEKNLITADNALYYSKEHCKGTCSVWSEIKDKIQ